MIQSSSFRINFKKCRVGSFIVGKSIRCMDVMELPEEVLIAARLQRTYEEMKTVLEMWKHNPVDSQILRIHPDKAAEYRRNHLEVFTYSPSFSGSISLNELEEHLMSDPNREHCANALRK